MPPPGVDHHARGGSAFGLPLGRVLALERWRSPPP